MNKMTHVGLDVHQDTIAIAQLTPGHEAPLVWQIPNAATSIRKTFCKLVREARELRCCYEAGPCGFEVQRQLESLGIECVVVAPSLIPRKPGERIKTDRRDAIKLARLDRAGDLTVVHIPTPEGEAVRDLVRAREDVRKDLVAARQRLTKFLLRHGRVFRKGKNWTQQYRAWLHSQTFEHTGEKLTFDHYVTAVEHQEACRDHLEKEIGAAAETVPYADAVERLSCLRGIATLSAMVLITEIQDFRRFTHPRQLMAYVGLSGWFPASARAARPNAEAGSPRQGTRRQDESSSRRPGTTAIRRRGKDVCTTPCEGNRRRGSPSRAKPRRDCTSALFDFWALASPDRLQLSLLLASSAGSSGRPHYRLKDEECEGARAVDVTGPRKENPRLIFAVASPDTNPRSIRPR